MRQITYRCRDIGYGVEEGTVRGDWAERDWTGKRRFHLASARAYGPDIYLFDDETVADLQVGCWIAGWNMPGYMPEMEPAAFESFDDAKAFIIDAMEREADHLDDYARSISSRFTTTDDASEAERAHSEAEELSSEQQDLNLASEGEWGVTVGNCAYWITYDADATTEDDEL